MIGKRWLKVCYKGQIDTNCSTRDLMMTFKFFHQLFCHPFKDEYSVVDRVKSIYPHITSMKRSKNKNTTLVWKASH